MLVLAAEPELDRHDTGTDHPEQPARLRAALSGLDAAGLRDAVVKTEPRRASDEELALVHPRSYFEALRMFCEAGGGAVDPDTLTVPGSWDTALLAVGGGLACVDALLEGAGDVGFVAARPPGHHASADRAMGFCLLNNIAVSAAYLAERGERVLIVDWDVHHGNGTQDIFWEDPRVLYVSTHQSPLYPGTGAVDQTGGRTLLGSPSTFRCRPERPATSSAVPSRRWPPRSWNASVPPGCSSLPDSMRTGQTRSPICG